MVLSESEFKDVIKKYTELETELEAASKTASVLRKKRNELVGGVLEFMQHHDIDEVNIGGEQQIRRVKTTSVESIKRESLREELERLMGDAENAERVVEAVMNNRSIVEKEKLKKIKKKDT